MGIVKQYNAEAKVRRLVPEVLRDFFVESADIVFKQPLKPRKIGYSWKTPKSLLAMRGDLKNIGDLGKEYDAFTFYKEDLDDQATLEWVTPGHPLYEGVRRQTMKTGEPHLASGARFYDPDGGPERWIQVFKYKLVDGNGVPVDEQLLLVEITKGDDDQFRYQIKPSTLFIDLVPNHSTKASIPILPKSIMLQKAQRCADDHLSKPGGLGPTLAIERKEKADLVREHIVTSLHALINKEYKKFESYEREQDKRLCLDRVHELEGRLEKREIELLKQGEVVIAQNIPIALAFVTPLPESFTDKQLDSRTTAQRLKKNTEAEQAAVDFVIRWELSHGAAKVESKESDGVGYDLESYDKDDNLLRFIEVKGKTTDDDGILTTNEWGAAERLREDYWLYVVENVLSEPQLLRIQDPFLKIHPNPQVQVQRYFFKMDEIRQQSLSITFGSK